MKKSRQMQSNIQKKLISVNLYRATIPMIVLAFVLMLVITFFSIFQLTQRSNDIMHSIEASSERYLNRYISSLDEVYYAVYSHFEDSKTLQAALQDYINSNDEIKNVWILDSNGIIVSGAPKTVTDIGFDHSGHDYFNALERTGAVYWSEVFITYGANIPIVSVSKRYEKGVVVLRVDLESFSKFLSVFDISENSSLAVTDQTGDYLAHSDYSNVYTRGYDPNRRQLQNDAQQLIKYNRSYVIAYHSALPEINWSIIFYQSLWDMLMPIITVLMVGVVVITIIGYKALKAVTGLNKELSGEFGELVEWTQQVAEGHYVFLESTSDIEEFQRLTESFQRMIKSVLSREEQLEIQRLEILKINQGLEKEVQNRTEDLEKSLMFLQNTQDQLVRKEKMAALGGLVSGVAHELNTPIGVALTAVSYLEKQNKQFLEALITNGVSKLSFTDYVSNVDESTAIIFRNMKRASDLIKSFKKVAIDQEKMHQEQMHLTDIVDATVTSLGVELKRRNVETKIKYRGDLRCESFPGAISQVLTNLIQNSMMHAFEDQDRPIIGIDCMESDDKAHILIFYWDNGVGIEHQELEKVYDPFYTTAQGSGGTGLGMNIVYNLINGLLMGQIEYIHKEDYGVCFKMTLPKHPE